jgi:hypothetical protein
MNKSDRIRRLLAKGLKASEIAKQLKVKPNLVHQVKWQSKKKKEAQPERSHDPKVKKAEKKYLKAVKTNKPSKIIKAVKEMKQALDKIEEPKVHKSLDGKVAWIEIPDLVNKPPHYTDGGYETLDFIEAKDLNYRLGNVVKYVSRAGKKTTDPVQDLEKARFYLEREILARRGA